MGCVVVGGQGITAAAGELRKSRVDQAVSGPAAAAT